MIQRTMEKYAKKTKYTVSKLIKHDDTPIFRCHCHKAASLGAKPWFLPAVQSEIAFRQSDTGTAMLACQVPSLQMDHDGSMVHNEFISFHIISLQHITTPALEVNYGELFLQGTTPNIRSEQRPGVCRFQLQRLAASLGRPPNPSVWDQHGTRWSAQNLHFSRPVGVEFQDLARVPMSSLITSGPKNPARVQKKNMQTYIFKKNKTCLRLVVGDES